MFKKSRPCRRFIILALVAFLSVGTAGAALAGNQADSFTTMVDPMSGVTAPLTSSLTEKVAVPTQLAVVTFFNDQTTFTAAAPGLTLEDFENGPAPGQLIGCLSTLSNATPGACYPAGELVDGFTFSATPGVTVALGPGIVPANPTTWVAADLFAAGSFFEFTEPDVFAVGFELFSFFGAPITVSVYGDGGALLGTAIHPVGATFFGVKTDATITRVEASAGAVATYDNLQFGSGIIDTDGDGIPDDDDACPNSDLTLTVVIDGCDSGVDNSLGADGCTISDLVGECAVGVSNHGQFVRCVSFLTNGLKKAGIISGRDKGAIMSCAAQSDIP